MFLNMGNDRGRELNYGIQPQVFLLCHSIHVKQFRIWAVAKTLSGHVLVETRQRIKWNYCERGFQSYLSFDATSQYFHLM